MKFNALLIIIASSLMFFGGYLVTSRADGFEEPKPPQGITVRCKIVKDIIYPSMEVKPVFRCGFKRN